MTMRRLAIMIDGAFFLKRLKNVDPNVPWNEPSQVANLIFRHALRHTNQRIGTKNRTPIFCDFELYRIFFYDCPPIEKKMHLPISKRSIDFAKSDIAKFRLNLHKELLKKRKVALRLGHLIETATWKLKFEAQTKLLRKEVTWEQLTDDDFSLDVIQKGIDMRLGIDVASLAYKNAVDQIIMIVGDSDFVPAAKLARREGIDVVIDPLGYGLHDHLYEHTDGVRDLSYKAKKQTPSEPEQFADELPQNVDNGNQPNMQKSFWRRRNQRKGHRPHDSQK
ncbi:NYN domain-containing protein [Falsochrobactrum ovis]|uniref:NYN domain-containing protein n=1 Tax=Falsochrobactrum ovis TaxID=1293442 RepID=A0A364JYZ8_9HYPH|nr:NYN domain-containing protein [Falsochrobactrum ovis]RAK33801.1 NYN domain-containing protein [Falsochrobactrum ovis]